tara:strand:+ start:176 stop:361 length:186 start_codon:yes stop_codon:yes gene_type:complete
MWASAAGDWGYWLGQASQEKKGENKQLHFWLGAKPKMICLFVASHVFSQFFSPPFGLVVDN